jgi:hypothetical protein
MCWRIAASSASECAPTGPGRRPLVFGGVSLNRAPLDRKVWQDHRDQPARKVLPDQWDPKDYGRRRYTFRVFRYRSVPCSGAA